MQVSSDTLQAAWRDARAMPTRCPHGASSVPGTMPAALCEGPGSVLNHLQQPDTPDLSHRSSAGWAVCTSHCPGEPAPT
eukprot:7435110-Alexandrium_andersonii.AAC.1